MRLIQARVSEDLFKAFSHYCVEHDWTVAECVGQWIEIHCGKDGGEKQPVSEFSCKVCGKPTDGAYVCESCVDNQKNKQ